MQPKNRKRLAKQESITIRMYNFLIKRTEAIDYKNCYQAARLRVTLTLFSITGIRIIELLSINDSN